MLGYMALTAGLAAMRPGGAPTLSNAARQRLMETQLDLEAVLSCDVDAFKRSTRELLKEITHASNDDGGKAVPEGQDWLSGVSVQDLFPTRGDMVDVLSCP